MPKIESMISSSKSFKKIEMVNLYLMISEEIPNIVSKSPEEYKLTTKFSFACTYNREMLLPLHKIVSEFQQTKIKEFAEFEDKRIAILKKHAEKNEKGEYLTKNENFVFNDESKKLVDDGISKLQIEYKDALEKRNAEVKELNQLLDEPIDISLTKTSIEYFPTWLNEWQCKILRPMIKETDEEIKEFLMK